MRKEKEITRTEKHHRRSQSLGGSNDPSNLSYVPPKLHRAWHVIYGDMNAEQACELTNLLSWKPEGIKVVCVFINGEQVMLQGKHNSKDMAKLQNAWEILFKDLSFEQAIKYINNVWLDPSYHFYIVED